MYKLPEVALEVPALKVIVEKFSNMGFILCLLSLSVKENIIQDILILICFRMIDKRYYRGLKNNIINI
jgi:hypothetical protein